jgi:hypothetical protein
MRFGNIVQAVGEDVAGFVTGFPAVGTAKTLLFATASLVLKRFSLLPKSYLDWELKDWWSIYKNETPLDLIYNGECLALPQVVILDNTDNHLLAPAIFIALERKQFTLRADVRAKTEEAFKAYERMMWVRRLSYSNETNVRLQRLEITSESATIIVQPVHYEDYIRTNLCLDADFRGQGLTLRKQIHAKGSLEPLEDSPLANNLGINILIFTADGQLIVQRRSTSVIVRPGEYCPSASGTIAFTDLPDNRISLSNLPTFREAYEELGLAPDDLLENTLCLLGITRELVRGGEPELFLYATTECSADDCRKKRKHARDRFESKDLLFFEFGELAFRALDCEQPKEKFQILFNKCVDTFGERMSIPLWTALALWKNARTSPQIRAKANPALQTDTPQAAHR